MSNHATVIDPIQSLEVSDDPRRITILGKVVPENLGGNAFRLLKFLADRKGDWFPTTRLTTVVWPNEPPVNSGTALSQAKRAINDTLRPYLGGDDAVESWPFLGYSMKPSLQTIPGRKGGSAIQRLFAYLARRIGYFADSVPLPRGAVLAFAVLMLLTVSWLVGLDNLLFARTVDVTIASSSTKQEWMDEVVGRFNERSLREGSLQVNRTALQIWGRPINVTIVLEEVEPGDWRHYRSGTMIADILGGKIRPSIASPAETVWIDKLMLEWPSSQAREDHEGGDSIISSRALPLTRTPFVIAMWESRARALDCWPESGPGCTWSAIIEIASKGWSAVGRGDWGAVKFGYAIPGKSNSATFTAVFACLSGVKVLPASLPEDLTQEGGCAEAIRQLEKAEIIRETSSSAIMRFMRDSGGPGAIDMVPTYEAEVVEVNKFFGPTLEERIVAVYPQDGTSVPSHPFGLLDEAPWVSSAEASAARVFEAFLRDDPQVAALVRHGIRPPNPDDLGAPIDPAHGAQPDANIVSLDVPGETIDQIVEVWNQTIDPSP